MRVTLLSVLFLVLLGGQTFAGPQTVKVGFFANSHYFGTAWNDGNGFGHYYL